MTIVVDASIAVKWVIPQAEDATLITADQRLLARVARGRMRVAVVDLATL